MHKNENSYTRLLQGNREWAARSIERDAKYFDKLAAGQQPETLWIGCSDSRVPVNEVTGTGAGEVFVHRNIANICVNTDMNMLSVVDYAVNVLKVKNVIVAGHYGCGGIAAAMGNRQYGLIDNWLRNIKDVYRLHSGELNVITDEKKKYDRLVELNVIEQVNNLSKTSIIQNAWRERDNLQVFGWVIDLATGLVKDLGVPNRVAGELGAVYVISST